MSCNGNCEGCSNKKQEEQHDEWDRPYHRKVMAGFGAICAMLAAQTIMQLISLMLLFKYIPQ